MLEINLLRSEHEEVSDKLLLMRLISKAAKHELGVPKLDKLAFLVEALTYKERIKTFNYSFFQTAKWGPQSNQLNQDYDILVANHIVAPNIPVLTKRGEDILKQSYEIFERNREVVDKIDEINR